jgi:hypothetical protein
VCASLSYTPFNREVVSPESLTLIMTLCPRKKNPSVSMIQEVLESYIRFMSEILKSNIIVGFDGFGVTANKSTLDPKCLDVPTTAQKYSLHKKMTKDVVVKHWPNAEFVELPDRVCLNTTLKTCVDHVRTPYIFVVQGDEILRREFSISDVLSGMASNDIDYLLFDHNSFNRHNYWAAKCGKKPSTKSRLTGDITIQRVLGFSDSTHFATLAFYNEQVFPRLVDTPHSFMEHHIQCLPNEHGRSMFIAHQSPFRHINARAHG